MDLTKTQERKIRSLSKAGKTQAQIARTLHKRRATITTYIRLSQVTRKPKTPVAQEFWKDVKAVKEAMGLSHKEATRTIKFSPKYVDKRLKRRGVPFLSAQAHEWALLERSARRERFKEGTAIDIEDYEDYFDTPA